MNPSAPLSFAVDGARTVEAIRGAAVAARPPTWNPSGAFRVTAIALGIGADDRTIGKALHAALEGSIVAIGSKLTTWIEVRKPSAAGATRIEVKVERIARGAPRPGQATDTLPLFGRAGQDAPATPRTGFESQDARRPVKQASPSVKQGTGHAAEPGADWPTDPYAASCGQ